MSNIEINSFLSLGLILIEIMHKFLLIGISKKYLKEKITKKNNTKLLKKNVNEI